MYSLCVRVCVRVCQLNRYIISLFIQSLVTSCFYVDCYHHQMQTERDAMDDLRGNSGGSWRHPGVKWNWTHSSRDTGRKVAVDVCSTFGRFLPRSYVSSVPPPPLPPPPPPLLPLAAVRRPTTFNGDIKLERVPTPTRADQLLVARGEQHDVTVCFPRRRPSRLTDGEEVKLVMMSGDSTATGLQADSVLFSPLPSYRQHINPTQPTETAARSDSWTDVVSDNSRQLTVGDWTALDNNTERLTELPSARADEVDADGSTPTAGDFQPSAVHHRLPPTSRCRWSSGAAQRRGVEFDAKYWERRRKNNEAAKRSRDMRRANERRVALRAALLERENARLRSEVEVLTDDTLRLHYYLLCSRTFACSRCQRHDSE